MCEFIKPSNNGMLTFQDRKHGWGRGADSFWQLTLFEAGESIFCPPYCYLLSPKFWDLSTALHLLSAPGVSELIGTWGLGPTIFFKIVYPNQIISNTYLSLSPPAFLTCRHPLTRILYCNLDNLYEWQLPHLNKRIVLFRVDSRLFVQVGHSNL